MHADLFQWRKPQLATQVSFENRRTRSADALVGGFLLDSLGTRGRGRPRSFLSFMRGCSVLPTFLAAAVIAGCSQQDEKKGAAPETEKKPGAESRVKHGTNDEVIITLDAGTQKIMDLRTAPLEAAQLSPEIKGYGHVLDTSPFGTLVAELVSAQAAAAASDAELKRLKALTAQNNASERAFQSAEAAAARDNAQVQAVRLRLIANWGTTLSERHDLPEFVQNLSSLSAVLVELALPAGERLPAAPTGARLVALADETRSIGAQLLGPAPMVDPQMQGKEFFLLVQPNSARLAPGAAVSGFLSFPGQPLSGVAVPRDAIVRFNGTTWLYLQTGDDTFKRVEVRPTSPLEQGWFVREGFSPGDKVVTVGAQQLLSEELKGQGGE